MQKKQIEFLPKIQMLILGVLFSVTWISGELTFGQKWISTGIFIVIYYLHVIKEGLVVTGGQLLELSWAVKGETVGGRAFRIDGLPKELWEKLDDIQASRNS